MSYQVLARKWRPRRFAELVGQEHVVRPLVNALERDRMHHAFLFTGTRGVGKTTIARILAKSLNCETGVVAQPCGTCRACTEIDEGRFMDLIEVDAASRTKVDDTRELLDNVQYAPTRGRYKVYLIDEVHMLSGHSFNALLKTLEEPPPHVKFLLATTDPQKLPVTVLSRCLQFNLKRLTPALIAAQLEKILGVEQVGFDPASLQLLARAADGSMRDGLSLLDQAIAYGGGKVAEAEVREMLGSIDQDAIERLLLALAQADGPGLLAVAADLSQHNADADQVLKELLFALHRIALAQTAPQTLAQTDDEQRWLRHAQALSPEDVQLFYQIGSLGRRDLLLAPDPHTGLEMTLVRMLAFRPVGLEVARDPPKDAQPKGLPPKEPQPKELHKDARPAAPAPQPANPAPRVPPVAVMEPAGKPVKGNAASTSANTSANGSPVAPLAASPDISWDAIVAQLKLGGVVRELANNCSLERATADEVRLVLNPKVADLNSKERAAALKQALTEYYGRDIRLHIRADQSDNQSPAQARARMQDERQQAAVEAISSDPNVRALQEQFDARIQPGSIRPKV